MGNTFQSNIKQYTSDSITNYSLFLGGLDVTSKSLDQYDPLKTGYGRIFFVKMPVFMEKIMPAQTKRVRHLMEYGFTRIDGLGNLTLEHEQITGGYAGRQFDVATTSKDDTNEITISMYEMAGSPLREYFEMWISGISDPHTGLAHYHGATIDGSANGALLQYKQANHVAEAIYVATDPTGKSSGIEYACLLTNMMPKSVKKDQFNFESGQHNLVQMDIPFTAVKYESPQINKVAKGLIQRFQTMRDFLDFKSPYFYTATSAGDTIDASFQTDLDTQGRKAEQINGWPTPAKLQTEK